MPSACVYSLNIVARQQVLSQTNVNCHVSLFDGRLFAILVINWVCCNEDHFDVGRTLKEPVDSWSSGHFLPAKREFVMTDASQHGKAGGACMWKI